jgi:cation diffusion facilitator CzcD-associated flavoprotein CzcO
MARTAPDPSQELDVLIVGAGISGVGAAWHLKDKSPDRSFAILEARDDLGGTWDLVPLSRHPLGQRHVHLRL